MGGKKGVVGERRGKIEKGRRGKETRREKSVVKEK